MEKHLEPKRLNLLRFLEQVEEVDRKLLNFLDVKNLNKKKGVQTALEMEKRGKEKEKSRDKSFDEKTNHSTQPTISELISIR